MILNGFGRGLEGAWKGDWTGGWKMPSFMPEIISDGNEYAPVADLCPILFFGIRDSGRGPTIPEDPPQSAICSE